MSETEQEKNKINYANRFVVVLIVALVVNLGLYWLPDSIRGIPIKKVDLLSDIRTTSAGNQLDLFAFLDDDDDAIAGNGNAGNGNATDGNGGKSKLSAEPDEPLLPMPTPQDLQQGRGSSAARQSGGAISVSNTNRTNSQSDRIASPPLPTPSASHAAVSTHESATSTSSAATTSSTVPSASQATQDDKNNTNYLFNTDIEDFSANHTSMRRFFAALNNINNLGRPVRVAFVGDSFIEGDIMVADFRAKMQERFGGRGVGFIPVTSNVAQYRPTIKQSANGWETYSIIKNRNRKYVLSGMLFEPAANLPSVKFQLVDMYPQLKEVSSLKFIYSKNDQAEMLLKNNTDTMVFKLPPTETVTQFEVKGTFTEGVLQFKNAAGLDAIGVAFEDNQGVVVDNFALRGNSGIIMSDLDAESCRELQQIRPYDLIVLQYGLNVASDSVLEYGWYRNKMVDVIAHIQDCFPGADILLLGVSDRSHRQGNAYSTMPAVVSLLRAQRQTARRAEIAFWSIFAAMGGQNSMVKYVDSNWASKDYTHLSFRGGREVANKLYDAIITEKGLYDGEEKLVEK